MKAVYFVRPIFRMFDFKGRASRAEYFSYVIPSALIGAFVFLATLVLMGPAGMNIGIRLPLPGPVASTLLPPLVVFISQFPMLALTVRRLRDQRAAGTALAWFFIPWLGPLVLFGHGFVPTFHDCLTTLPDGRTMMLSEAVDERRRRNRLIALGVFVVSCVAISDAAMAAAAAESSSTGSGGGGRRGVKGSPWKADGSINNRNNILGGRKAHMRGGRPVKASHNKYTWN